MSYLTPSEYADITGRGEESATAGRLSRASRLLDSRIGRYPRLSSGDYSGFKLDLDRLPDFQKEAVKEWVGWMSAALVENGDAPDTFASIKLGRFSVSENEADKNNSLPDMVRYADMQLRDAGLINTHVRSSRYVTQKKGCY